MRSLLAEWIQLLFVLGLFGLYIGVSELRRQARTRRALRRLDALSARGWKLVNDIERSRLWDKQ